MAKVRMQRSGATHASVEGVQYEAAGGLVSVEDVHVGAMKNMGWTVVTSDDDILLSKEAWIEKRAPAEYERYLADMRARLGSKFVDPNVPATDPKSAPAKAPQARA